ncbi:hypothetical protein NEPTK9_000572 [Candidatus Neptunochlamydia vexilliferae]|uniref:Transposase n=1 Tax=Candidatus Neptunichlamydia vexilliferae TaxID=1651774 RepID=A0ABS0AY67_9BACT|nr:hypothetical protein [Candidatus Neptunochlamydia vexilliferae]
MYQHSCIGLHTLKTLKTAKLEIFQDQQFRRVTLEATGFFLLLSKFLILDTLRTF